MNTESKNTSGEQESKQNIWKNMWKPYVDSLTDKEILEDKFDRSKLQRDLNDFILNEKDYYVLPKTEVFDHYETSGYGKKAVRRTTSIEEASHLLVGLTQEMIYRIDDNNQPPIDEIVYLDKSGRPVSWLVNLFWKDFASKNESGATVKRPKHSYVNIDRGRILESFFGMTRSVGDAMIDRDNNWYESHKDAWDKAKSNLKPEHFAQLRALYLDEELKDNNYQPEEILKMPSRLDGKNILIIDEVEASGATFEMARALFEGAFPGCKVRTATFWHESALKSVPPWYNKYISGGRGVGDVDPTYYEDLMVKYSDDNYYRDLGVPEEKIPKTKEIALSRTRAKEIGKNLLSSMINLEEENDELSRKFAADFKQLHKDYLAHKVVPYFGRADEDRSYIELVRQGINPSMLATIKEEVFSKRKIPQY